MSNVGSLRAPRPLCPVTDVSNGIVAIVRGLQAIAQQIPALRIDLAHRNAITRALVEAADLKPRVSRALEAVMAEHTGEEVVSQAHAGADVE